MPVAEDDAASFDGHWGPSNMDACDSEAEDVNEVDRQSMNPRNSSVHEPEIADFVANPESLPTDNDADSSQADAASEVKPRRRKCKEQ